MLQLIKYWLNINVVCSIAILWFKSSRNLSLTYSALPSRNEKACEALNGLSISPQDRNLCLCCEYFCCILTICRTFPFLRVLSEFAACNFFCVFLTSRCNCVLSKSIFCFCSIFFDMFVVLAWSANKHSFHFWSSLSDFRMKRYHWVNCIATTSHLVLITKCGIF